MDFRKEFFNLGLFHLWIHNFVVLLLFPLKLYTQISKNGSVFSTFEFL